MRRDYPKIQRAGAELVIFSPDSLGDHLRYGRERFDEELPWRFVSDPAWGVARRYGVLRDQGHPHGGFWNRSLWVLDRAGIIAHRLLPWEVSTTNGQVTEGQIAEYGRLFTLIGAEPGEYQAACDVGASAIG